MITKNKTISQEDTLFDKQHLWHPYTSLTQPLPVYPVVSANGVRIELSDGKKLIDGTASWWSTIHGYNHPLLNQAIQNQTQKMAHIMFGGLTHQPAIDIGKKLVALTPEGLDAVFLCDSGSISVEVAMKMAIQYQHGLGKVQKSKFLTLKKGYHGDTTGAMSVCDPVTGMHHLFQDFMPKHYFLEAPELGYDKKLSSAEKEAIVLFFAEYAAEAAAFILEPIVQGAGGMRIYSPEYLTIIRTLCNKYEILLIADEIATGFGRTGKMFAVEHAQITPDILCLGKALTGGYMTMAATICTRTVAHTICNGEAGVMMHGPTFMANPLACAVANASLELLIESNWQQRIKEIETILKQNLSEAIQYKEVKSVRVLGAIGVIETRYPVDAALAQAFFVEQGVWIRPFRKLIYIMPPYIINKNDLERLCEVMLRTVQSKKYFINRN